METLTAVGLIAVGWILSHLSEYFRRKWTVGDRRRDLLLGKGEAILSLLAQFGTWIERSTTRAVQGEIYEGPPTFMAEAALLCKAYFPTLAPQAKGVETTVLTYSEGLLNLGLRALNKELENDDTQAAYLEEYRKLRDAVRLLQDGVTAVMHTQVE